MPGLRRLIVGRYLIFYFPRPDGIEAARVLDGRRDIKAVFEQP
jgi:plasmid stabilization system protein ParE